MRQHPLFFFFLMAYAFSWIMVIPFILEEWGYLPKAFSYTFILVPFVGPFLAAFSMTRLTEGKEGVLRLRRRMVQTRAGWQWYLFILLGIPALFLMAMFVIPGVRMGPNGIPPKFLVTYLVNFVIVALAGGPLGEEPGWRGFALPRLQTRYGALKGTLILGVVWTFWHLPHFLTSAQGGGPGMTVNSFLINLVLFFLLVMAITVIMTWVFNNTAASVFIAILLHASINTQEVVAPFFHSTILSPRATIDLAMLIAMVVPALLVLILTRGRLGYRHEQAQPVAAGNISANLGLGR